MLEKFQWRAVKIVPEKKEDESQRKNTINRIAYTGSEKEDGRRGNNLRDHKFVKVDAVVLCRI